MKPFEWNDAKNELLKEERGISFEDILYYIEKREILDLVPHPLQAKDPGQRMFIVAIDNYAYLVPFIKTGRRCVF